MRKTLNSFPFTTFTTHSENELYCQTPYTPLATISVAAIHQKPYFSKDAKADVYAVISRYPQGQADPLNSAFHLTYNMVLNLLRVEEVNPEIMLERSFYQFQNYAAIPGMVESEYTQYM